MRPKLALDIGPCATTVRVRSGRLTGAESTVPEASALWTVSPNMVTAGEAPLNAPLATATTPLFATSRILATDLFPIHTWQPRAGRDENLPRWKAGVRRLHAAFGVTESQLAHAVQYFSNLRYGAISLDIDEPGLHASIERAAALDEQWGAWQRINTAIYWHILPSVEVSTAHAQHDQRVLNTLHKGHLADGVGLLAWLTSFVEASSPLLRPMSAGRALAALRLVQSAARSFLSRRRRSSLLRMQASMALAQPPVPPGGTPAHAYPQTHTVAAPVLSSGLPQLGGHRELLAASPPRPTANPIPVPMHVLPGQGGRLESPEPQRPPEPLDALLEASAVYVQARTRGSLARRLAGRARDGGLQSCAPVRRNDWGGQAHLHSRLKGPSTGSTHDCDGCAQSHAHSQLSEPSTGNTHGCDDCARAHAATLHDRGCCEGLSTSAKPPHAHCHHCDAIARMDDDECACCGQQLGVQNLDGNDVSVLTILLTDRQEHACMEQMQAAVVADQIAMSRVNEDATSLVANVEAQVLASLQLAQVLEHQAPAQYIRLAGGGTATSARDEAGKHVMERGYAVVRNPPRVLLSINKELDTLDRHYTEPRGHGLGNSRRKPGASTLEFKPIFQRPPTKTLPVHVGNGSRQAATGVEVGQEQAAPRWSVHVAQRQLRMAKSLGDLLPGNIAVRQNSLIWSRHDVTRQAGHLEAEPQRLPHSGEPPEGIVMLTPLDRPTNVWVVPQVEVERLGRLPTVAEFTTAVDGGALDAPLPRVGGHIWLSHSPVSPSPQQPPEVLQPNSQLIKPQLDAQLEAQLHSSPQISPRQLGLRLGQVEVRVDQVDGCAYTLDEFVEEYGGTREWELAAEVQPDTGQLHSRQLLLSKPMPDQGGQQLGTGQITPQIGTEQVTAQLDTGQLDAGQLGSQLDTGQPALRLAGGGNDNAGRLVIEQGHAVVRNPPRMLASIRKAVPDKDSLQFTLAS